MAMSMDSQRTERLSGNGFVARMGVLLQNIKDCVVQGGGDASIADWPHPSDVPPRPQAEETVRRGMVVAAILFGGFGGWAALAPIESAAVATAEIRVESHHRTVANLEG